MTPVESTLRSIAGPTGSFVVCLLAVVFDVSSFGVHTINSPTCASSLPSIADPVRQYIVAGTVEVEATEARPTHSVVKVKCMFCQRVHLEQLGARPWSSERRPVDGTSRGHSLVHPGSAGRCAHVQGHDRRESRAEAPALIISYQEKDGFMAHFCYCFF